MVPASAEEPHWLQIDARSIQHIITRRWVDIDRAFSSPGSRDFEPLLGCFAGGDGTLSRMSDQSATVLQFLKGQEICQIAFGMYDLQINWGNGGLSCTGRVIYKPNAGVEVVWTEGHPFDAVPMLRLLQQTIQAFDGSKEGELSLRFSNGDRLTVTRDDGPQGFTIHQVGHPLIVG